MTEARKNLVLVVLMGASALLAAAGALILTDAGQLLAIGKSLVVGYFRVHRPVMILSALLLGAAVYVNHRWDMAHGRPRRPTNQARRPGD